jgi:preprotein translocase subunit SecA
MNVTLRDQQAGSSFAAKNIVDWAKDKYQAELSLEEVQGATYDKLRKQLLDLSESYSDGRMKEEIDHNLGQLDLGDRAGREKALDWASGRFDIKPDQEDYDRGDVREYIERGAQQYMRRELTELERYVLLQIYDATWKDHLYAMDHLKHGIGLRGFAERDPKLEYKKEGFRMFEQMLSSIRDKVTDIIFKARLESGESMRSVWNISAAHHADYERFQAQQEAAQQPQGEKVAKTIKLEKPKVGRNEPCPCGSGRKYKKCCGRNA